MKCTKSRIYPSENVDHFCEIFVSWYDAEQCMDVGSKVNKAENERRMKPSLRILKWVKLMIISMKPSWTEYVRV